MRLQIINRILKNNKDLVSKIDGFLLSVFGKNNGQFDYDPIIWSLLLTDKDKIISHVGFGHCKNILIGKNKYFVSGIGGVATEKYYRNHGYASKLLKNAFKLMRENFKVDYGILLCAPEKLHFYTTNGFIKLSQPSIITSRGKIIADNDNYSCYIPITKIEPVYGKVNYLGQPW